jgi:hypothetical protein
MKRSGPPVLKRIDTSPVGFAVFDQLLLTVHPTDCAVRDAYAARLLNATTAESRSSGVKLPTSPADMMLRIVNQMVDGYLELRRELTRQLDHWQAELLRPGTRFTNWSSVLDARLAMHHLDEICEDQRSAVQDWVDSIETWPEGATPPRYVSASCSRCAHATCSSTSSAWCTTCGAWSKAPRPRCRCIFRRKATAPTTSCARSPRSPPSFCR